MVAEKYKIEELISEVQHLRLEAGDILAVLSKNRLTSDQSKDIIERMSEIVPKTIRVIVIDSEVQLARVSVVKGDDDGSGHSS